MDWVKAQNIRSFEQIGDQSTTAQVTPELFTKTLLEEAQKTGRLNVCIGKGVTELVYDEDIVTGVQLEGGEVFTGDAVVLCMGAWTGNLALKKGERIPVSGVRVHSIVMRPDAPIPNQALFTAILDNSKTSEPEVR
jgi:glycine/D-amino acid oxidase-like deaminating enzyme